MQQLQLSIEAEDLQEEKNRRVTNEKFGFIFIKGDLFQF